jgi:2-oxoglutarate ferredoxin oxidoreductase subunit beta
MSLAQDYGRKLYTGVFYRDPEPRPTYEQTVAERHRSLTSSAPARTDILNAFIPR